MYRFMAAVIVAVALSGGLATPVANALPLVGCEHREAGHVDRHGGQLEDDRFHRMNGERVTCSDDKERHSDDKNHQDDKHGDGHIGDGIAGPSRGGSSDHPRCIGRCNRDHSLWH